MKKKILIISWRDPKSPLEGGAERFTKKYGEFWAQNGHQVYWLTNTFFKAKQNETIDGVTYLRIGPQLDGSLFKYLFFYPLYLLNTISFAHKFIKQHKIDLVIDEIHGLPFFTPLFSKTRNVLLVCEVAELIWDKMFPFPINIIGKWIEKLIYQIYKNTEIWTISQSTEKNINRLLPNKRIKIINLGIDENKKNLNKIKNIKKTPYPSALFLARLVKMKGIESAIDSTAEIVKKLPKFKLFIIGDGNNQYKKFLKNRVKQLKIEQNIQFLGKVSELDKFRYLKKVHFLLHPSFREGFGLTVIEAGSIGTPAIIRSGSSMDALIIDGKTGFSFEDEKQMAQIFIKNYQSKRYTNIVKQVKKKARQYLWHDVLKKSQEIGKVE